MLCALANNSLKDALTIDFFFASCRGLPHTWQSHGGSLVVVDISIIVHTAAVECTVAEVQGIAGVGDALRLAEELEK